jgi:glycosyltransferase involved in cell wall biosynthesis
VSARLALVVSTTSDDGGGVMAARLRHLLDAGWDAHLLCKGESWAREPALSAGLPPERVQVTVPRRRESNPFARPLRRLRPDLVHFHSAWTAVRGLRFGRLASARVVVSLRRDGQDLVAPSLERLWRRADLFLFRDEPALERAVARGCPPDRCEILPPPVPAFEPAVDGRGPLRLLSVGPLRWEQGYEHSIHAVRLLLDQGIPCEYRIVGAGEHAEAVAFARHQLGLADHVELLSANGSDGIGPADVFVDPAVADGVDTGALASAQAHGIPYVATTRAELPDGAGIAVPRRDPTALADALARLARDPALRSEMGRTARRLARPPTVAHHHARLEALYRRALG